MKLIHKKHEAKQEVPDDVLIDDYSGMNETVYRVRPNDYDILPDGILTIHKGERTTFRMTWLGPIPSTVVIDGPITLRDRWSIRH